MNERQNESEAHADHLGTAGRQSQDPVPDHPQAAPPGTVDGNAARQVSGSFTEGLMADAMPLPEGEWIAAQLQDEQIGKPWCGQDSSEVNPTADSAERCGSRSDTMAHLLDLRLPLTIELGRTEMSVAEILELNQGSIVELDKLSGEPVDLLINQQPVAKGEVVVIDDRFGIRITQLVKPGDRISTLSLQ